MADIQDFDWQQTVETKSQGVAIKTISASEIDPTRSNKHSFHGVVPFRKLLGEKRVTLHAIFVYVADDHEVTSESFVTWYDDCETNKKNPECKNHWRLYYPDILALSYAKPDNRLLVARLEDEELVLVITPQNSLADKWIMQRYRVDKRLDTVQPPQPTSFPQISLPQSFSQAKKLLTNKVYANDNERQTFYCGCNYSRDGKIDPLSCGYEPKRPGSARSKRLEWEHIVPAAYIGRGRACWETGVEECKNRKGKSYKGRRCCEKVDAQFRQITADLNNIVPEIGELNADRSNFPHREIEGEKREYGACDFEVDTKLKEAEPAVPLRGFIGRTWLYMYDVHKVQISPNDLNVYQAWADAYPPQEWELARKKRIKSSTLINK